MHVMAYETCDIRVQNYQKHLLSNFFRRSDVAAQMPIKRPASQLGRLDPHYHLSAFIPGAHLDTHPMSRGSQGRRKLWALLPAFISFLRRDHISAENSGKKREALQRKGIARESSAYKT